MGSVLKLKLPRHQLKTIKNALETSGCFLEPFNFEHNTTESGSIITAVCNDAAFAHDLSQEYDGHIVLFRKLRLEDLGGDVEVLEIPRAADNLRLVDQPTSKPSGLQAAKLASSVLSWLHSLKPHGLLGTSDVTELLDSCNTSRYQIYRPMLLFSSGAFEAGPWKNLLGRLPTAHRNDLFERIARAMDVTHIAVNAPIPRTSSSATCIENTIRTPTNLKILHGDFGPVVQRHPTATDLEDALWVSTTQNGIVQTWAPRYTMFSRGNIAEKTRVLALPSVADAVAQGRSTGHGCAAVDLYAGIGYFAFSYVKAGVDKVLCFEINPWSTEGLRRGAAANRWAVNTIKGDASVDSAAKQALASSSARLVALEMSNEYAGAMIENSRSVLPPVRHVNCGLLPSSRGSWATAVRVIDPVLGGWLHLHENMATEAIDETAAVVLKDIAALVRDSRGPGHGSPVLEHVQRVKTYAPGVMHCVLDIYVPPLKT